MTRLQLPLLAPHDEALQKCVYCPRLSRAACPVSNVEGNETLTPWGKMSMAYFTARGDVPVDEEHAAPAWACSACFGCRERCDHRNEVATVLTDARAEYFAAGAAPRAARAVAAGYQDHARDTARAVADIDEGGESETVLLVGCSYARHSPAVARDIYKVTRRLVGEVRLVRRCCGMPLLQAGDRVGFERAARELAAELEGSKRIIVADPGCARTLMIDYARTEVAELSAELLVDVIYAEIDQLPAGVLGDRRFRYHDPCQLGRGLGRYDEPRAILSRISGRAPDELPRNREIAECSGGGGLLPLTRPETSCAIADGRIAEHKDAGGGVLVSACGESLRRFRSRGEQVVDLVSLVAEACLPKS
jgi:Fe-S oxidoreductase